MKTLSLNLLAFVILAFFASSVSAQTAAFTYQGRLTDGANQSPTATYDIKFDLYDMDVDGALIGSVTNTAVFVNNGVFTTSLNFGAAAFDGGLRYLEISIRPAGSSATRTTLQPRQRITSTPYATQSNKATTAKDFTNPLTGDVTGTQTATVVSTVGGETAANVASGAQIANAATSANVADTVVRRDAGGNFAASTVTAGNVTLATGGKVMFADGTQQATSVDPSLFVVRNVQSGSVIVNDNRLNVNVPQGSIDAFRVTNPADSSAFNNFLLRLRSSSFSTTPSATLLADRFRIDQASGFVAIGQVGYGVIPASGEGVRFMWHPFKGSMRVGAASSAGEFDDGNIGFYSFAGGNRTIANDFASFAFGDQVTVTGQNAVGFGGNSTIDGNFGFSSGSQNKCIGFVCTAIGFTAIADGQGAFALGYRASAVGDYSYVLGRYGRTGCNGGETDCTTAFSRSGSFVFADASINGYMDATANNQFNVRARGGIRLRTSTATQDNVGVNANTGCDIPGNSGSMSCASSRFVKENYLSLKPESVLLKIRQMPVMRWNYIGDESGESHIGPFAEDFQAAFKLYPGDKSIGAQDLSGVALIGVQALDERTAKLQAENETLRRQLEIQQTQFAALEERLKKLEQAAPRSRNNRRRK
jgi:hypothetical protein